MIAHHYHALTLVAQSASYTVSNPCTVTEAREQVEHSIQTLRSIDPDFAPTNWLGADTAMLVRRRDGRTVYFLVHPCDDQCAALRRTLLGHEDLARAARVARVG